MLIIALDSYGIGGDQTALEFLEDCISAGSVINRKVLNSLLAYMKSSIYLGSNQYALLAKTLVAFQINSRNGIISSCSQKIIIQKLESKASVVEKTTDEESDWRNKLALGDELEIEIENGVWVTGAVVRRNLLTGEVQLEYSLLDSSTNNANMQMISLDRNSSSMRRPVGKLSANFEDLFVGNNRNMAGPTQNTVDLAVNSNPNIQSSTFLNMFFGKDFIMNDAERLRYFSSKFPKCRRGHFCRLEFNKPGYTGLFECEKCSNKLIDIKTTDESEAVSCEASSKYWLCNVCQPTSYTCSKCFPSSIGESKVVCLVGPDKDSVATIYSSPSASSTTVGIISHGTVLEVVDCGSLEVYRTANGQGYVLKEPNNRQSWNTLSADRYAYPLEAISDTLKVGISTFQNTLNPRQGNKSGIDKKKMRSDYNDDSCSGYIKLSAELIQLMMRVEEQNTLQPVEISVENKTALQESFLTAAIDLAEAVSNF